MANYSISAIGGTTGNINFYIGSQYSYYVRCNIKLTAQSQVNRTSTLELTYYWCHPDGTVSGTTTKYGATINGNNIAVSGSDVITISGTKWFKKKFTGSQSSPYQIGKKTVTVHHDTNGSFSLKTLVLRGGYGSEDTLSGGSNTANHTLTLPTISVSSPISVSPSTELVVGSSEITVTITPGDSSWRHKISIGTTGSSEDVVLSTTLVAAGTTTVTYTIPSSLASYITTSKTKTMYIVCRPVTSNGSYLGYSSVSRVFRVPETSTYLPECANENISHTAAIPSSNAQGYVVPDYGYVSGISHVSVAISNIVTKLGATVSSVSINIGGVTYIPVLSSSVYTLLTDSPIQSSGTVPMIITITDSRGMSITKNVSIEGVIQYTPPRIFSLSSYRSNSDGTQNSEGTHIHIDVTYSVTSVKRNNVEYNLYACKGSFKSVDEVNYTTISPLSTPYYDTDNPAYTSANMEGTRTGIVAMTTLYVNTDHNIAFEIKDMLGGTIIRASDIMKSSGNIFLNFKNDGTGIGIGSFANLPNGIDIGWRVRFQRGIVPASISNNVSLDTIQTPGFYQGSTTQNITGLPTGVSGNFGLDVKSLNNSNVVQILYSGSAEYRRQYISNVWSTWTVQGFNPSSPTDKQAIVDLLYPVGSIYMSLTTTDPNTQFGGTWVKIAQGTFLTSAGTGTGYTLGATGGAASQSVSAHKHLSPIGRRGWTAIALKSVGGTAGSQSYTGSKPAWASSNNTNSYSDVTEYYTGDGGSHTVNTVPPYLAVNMWRRTA